MEPRYAGPVTEKQAHILSAHPLYWTDVTAQKSLFFTVFGIVHYDHGTWK